MYIIILAFSFIVFFMSRIRKGDKRKSLRVSEIL